MSTEIVPFGTEALVGLEDAGALDGLGLDPAMFVGLTFEQYSALGALLGRAWTGLRWAVGDWIAVGEERFGELAAQASELLGLSPEGRMELARVARAIPRSRRRAALSWGHHRLVAARWIEPRQRGELLNEAEREGWTVRELEAAVRELRAMRSHAAPAATGVRLRTGRSSNCRDRGGACLLHDDAGGGVSDLDRILGPDLVQALEKIISERIEAALASHADGNGGSPWLTITDAAEYAHVSTRTISRLLDRGRIRSTTIGRRRLLHRDDLDAYLMEERR